MPPSPATPSLARRRRAPRAPRAPRSRRAAHVLAGAVLFTLPSVAVARAFDTGERPPWEHLPVETDVVLEEPADFEGKVLVLGDPEAPDHEFFVWDWAFVRHPDGRILTLYHELQSPEGAVYVHFSELSEHPPGSAVVRDLRQVFGGSVRVIADDRGRIRLIPAGALDEGATGPGGRIFRPGEVTGGGACYLRPILSCPLWYGGCAGFGSPCVMAGGVCVCMLTPHPHDMIQTCPFEVDGHECVSRSCERRCVDPCVCEGDEDDDGAGAE